MEGFVRPKAEVLDERAIVPEKNLISPAPNQFTHKVSRSQKYYFAEAREGGPPDGHFQAGTKVVLLVHHGGKHCRVADGRGLYVEIEYNSLKEL